MSLLTVLDERHGHVPDDRRVSAGYHEKGRQREMRQCLCPSTVGISPTMCGAHLLVLSVHATCVACGVHETVHVLHGLSRWIQVIFGSVGSEIHRHESIVVIHKSCQSEQSS